MTHPVRMYTTDGWIDLGVSSPPSLVAALPASPTEGLEVYFQNAAMATAGVVWHLRWSSAQARWQFLGGPALRSEAQAMEGPRGPGVVGTYYAFTTDTPIVVPASGLYEARAVIGVSSGNTVAVLATIQIAETANPQTPLGVVDGSVNIPATANYLVPTPLHTTVTLVAGRTVHPVFAFSNTSATLNFSRKFFSIQPLYLT